MKKMMNEGLKENDLQDLVLRTISIDEFESKIDDNAIVIGFYVSYSDPAYDLNKFIQKTNVDIIDTDVSPAPTEDGYYIVFVELERDENLYNNILELVSTINNLVDIDDWEFNCYGYDDTFELNKENLEKYINTQDIKESLIYNFLSTSSLDDLIIEDREIMFVKNNRRLFLEFVDFGKIEEIRKYINEGADYSLSSLSKVNRISSFIGYDWIVESIGNYISIRKDNEIEMVVKTND